MKRKNRKKRIGRVTKPFYITSNIADRAMDKINCKQDVIGKANLYYKSKPFILKTFKVRRFTVKENQEGPAIIEVFWVQIYIDRQTFCYFYTMIVSPHFHGQ